MPEESVAKRWVESELFESVPLQVIRINRGAPLAAKAFIDKGSAGKHEALLSAFSKYLTEKQGIFDVTDCILKSDRDGLKWLSFYLLDVIKIQQGTHEALVHCDSEKMLMALAESLSHSKVIQQLMALNKLKAEMVKHTGLNSELLISRWLSDF